MPSPTRNIKKARRKLRRHQDSPSVAPPGTAVPELQAPTQPTAASTTTVGGIKLTAKMRDALEKFCAANVSGKIAESLEELDRDRLLALVLPAFLVDWRKRKSQPDNPKLVTDNAEARFQFKQGIKMVVPKPLKNVKEALQATGMHHKRAERFAKLAKRRVSTELLDSFEHMLASKDTEIAEAAGALLAHIKSDESLSKLLSKKTDFVLKDEKKFLRALIEESRSVEEMLQLLKVFVPPMQFTHTAHNNAIEIVYGRQDALHTYQSNGAKCVVEGTLAHLFEKSGRKWQKLGTKSHKTAKAAEKFGEDVTNDPKVFAKAVKTLKS